VITCADIILSDLNMPQVQGLNFVETLVAKGCVVPHIALMSGEWSDADETRAARLGGRLFRKPFSLDITVGSPQSRPSSRQIAGSGVGLVRVGQIWPAKRNHPRNSTVMVTCLVGCRMRWIIVHQRLVTNGRCPV
jgi:hypothetical protein